MSVAFVGLDLAWGERARSGVAVLDGAGALLRSGTAISDDDIADLLGTASSDAAVVAIDAPLLVPNPTGRRTCEASVARAFARFHAGPHPSNRGMPAFRDGTRGARLGRRLGWRIHGDPDGTSPDGPEAAGSDAPLAIEVYPHPAMVALFGLSRVLPYKARPGRSLATRQRALLTVMAELEDACGATLRLDRVDRWHELMTTVTAASRPVELKRAEDEVDAVLCAYLAWLWGTAPDRLVCHGDGSDGYIVTPPAPSS